MKYSTKWSHRLPLIPVICLGAIFMGYPALGEETPWTLSANESDLLQEDAPVVQTPAIGGETYLPGISLAEVLVLAIQNNPDLRVLKAEVNASQMQWLAEGLLPNPTVTGGRKKVSGGPSGPVVEFEQELPVNGSLKMERESARLGYRAAEVAALRKTQEILHQVQVQAIKVLAAKASELVEKENLRIITESFNLVTNRFESGLVAELPLSLAKAERGAAENSAQLAAKEITIQREKLAILLGLSEGELPAIGGSIHATLLPPDVRQRGASRDDLRAKDLEVQSAQAMVEAARRARIPNPTLGYSREEAGDDTENFFTLSLE
ncbi:MAG: TolC family protein, partial [Candidatus Omnitrophica bacterium]|nr:TolC family protein [Candidatus Omnitrophota bacterium]